MKKPLEYIELNFLEVIQPIGGFYVCVMSWQDIIDTTYADIRDIKEKSDSKELDNYLGIQRKVSKNRVKEIGQYVNNIDATFPTSIILHIKSESLYYNDELLEDRDEEFLQKNANSIEIIDNIKIDESKSKLLIRKDNRVAKILDGQHRIEGFRLAKNQFNEIEQFDFNVTVFVDLGLDDQAQIFSVINKAQTKVNKSLVYDLYEYATNRSPQKTAHDIVRALNKSDKSPFFRSIKILGTARNKDLETIAQATLAELIIDSTSKNPMNDRNELKKKSIFGKGTLNKLTTEKEVQRRIFRNLFIDEKDDIIYQIIRNYFNAVSLKWKRAWNNAPPIAKNILKKSTGIVALFRFMRYLYNSENKVEKVMSEQEFSECLKHVKLEDTDFTTDNYKPGSSGQSTLYKELIDSYETNKLSS